MTEIRRFEVGMSVDALASAWARQEGAPGGSVVTVATEISGRGRGGVPWQVRDPDGLMMAMVARPRIPPRQEGLLWLAVTLAAAGAIEAVTGREGYVLWPDSVSFDGDEPICCTNVGVQLGPDRIEHAVLSVRVHLALAGVADRERLLGAVIEALEAVLVELETEPVALVEAFCSVYGFMDRLVKATLLPRGSARGRVAAIDPNGDLVLESTTGMLERISAANLRYLELAQPAPGSDLS